VIRMPLARGENAKREIVVRMKGLVSINLRRYNGTGQRRLMAASAHVNM
jgi:hypothetical protein